MNELFRLTLLGSPRLLMGSKLVSDFATNKAQALLFYLVVTGQPHSRERLATLLWDEMTDVQAKKNLRTVLPDLRRLVGEHLLIERQTVAFQRAKAYWLDVEVLRRSLTPRQAPTDLAVRQAAVELYGGEFLSGFYVHNAPAFDAWVLEQREQLHTLVVTTLTGLVDEHAQRADYAAALAANRRLLVLEPWSEPVHRQQMLLLAQTGERAAALVQFETCQRVLAAEFGVAPLAETTALYQQIRHGEIGGQGERESRAPTVKKPVEKVAGGEPTGSDQLAQIPSQAEPMTGEMRAPPRVLDAECRILVHGHNLPQRTTLYGRQEELSQIQKWIVEDGCRLVGIFGIGGQGKTALAARLVRRLAEPASQPAPAPPFQRIIWQSLLNAPPLAEVIQEWLYVLSDQAVTNLPTSLDQQFSQLLDYLRHQRCLLVLDNLESILQGGERSGYYRPGYEGYGQLLHRLVAGEHHSCLLLTSRERPQDLTHLEEDAPAVRFLALTGLPIAAGQAKLHTRGVVGDPAALAALVQQYSGNPLALKLVAETVQNIFGGDITAFLQAETLVFDDIREVLDQQFARLAPLERDLMVWLAIVREPVSFGALRDLLAHPPASRLVLEAIRALQRRSLLEKYDEGFGLQNVVLEYVTDLLIENIGRELDASGGVGAWGRGGVETHSAPLPHASSFLNRYALVLAQTKEYVRASQTRLLLQPVAERLVAHLGSMGADQQIQALLAHLRRVMLGAPGYAAANLLHLALQLGSDLQGYDISGLTVRQADLRLAQLHNVNFAGADLPHTLFKETFGGGCRFAISADGQLLAAVSSQGEVRVWRLADGQPLAVYEHPQGAVAGVAFSPDGRTLASACGDQQVYLWDVSTLLNTGVPAASSRGALRATLKGHTTGVYHVAFSPDGQLLASSGFDQKIILWDVATGQQRQVLPVATVWIRSFAFSPDGQQLACACDDDVVRLWSVATGRLLCVCVGHTAKVTAVAFSSDGQRLVSGSDDCSVRLWAVESGELQHTFPPCAHFVLTVAFSPDGRRVACAGADERVTLWDLGDAVGWAQARVYTLQGHTEPIWSIGFTPDGQNLVSSAYDNTIRLWAVATGRLLRIWQGQAEWYYSIAFHPDGRRLASGDISGVVHLWDTELWWTAQRERQIRLPGHQRQIMRVAFSPDGQTLASASGDQTIRLWDVPSRQLRTVLYGHTGWVHCVAFSPDRQTLASAGSDQTIRLWDVTTGQTRVIIRGHTNSVVVVAFSPNGELLASASERTIRLWDRQGQLLRLFQREATLTALAFSPDGLLLASCGGDQKIHIWEVATGRLCQTLYGHSGPLNAVVFSPDGQHLFSGGDDRTIVLWNLADGRLLRTLHGHKDLVLTLAINQSGERLASSSSDRTIRLWDMQTTECIQILRADGPYMGMNITGITGVTEAQKIALKALGAVVK